MRFLALFLLALPAWAQAPLSAADIMARVGANQDRAEALRKQYVYQQHIHVVSKQTNGRLKREETSDYDMVPTADGTQRKLTSLTGRFLHKGQYVEFSGQEPRDEQGDDDGMDADLTRDFRDDLCNEKSKDGLGRNLFPFTTANQARYKFKLLGEDTQDGRAVYHIAFAPRDEDDLTWAGETYIDQEDFQPVTAFTKLSRKLPLLVRGALGTDLPGIGFSVHYKRQPDGVWFPVSFGTEFRLKVLFFMKRDISLSLENRNFQRTHVDSKITVLGEPQ